MKYGGSREICRQQQTMHPLLPKIRWSNHVGNYVEKMDVEKAVTEVAAYMDRLSVSLFFTAGEHASLPYQKGFTQRYDPAVLNATVIDVSRASILLTRLMNKLGPCHWPTKDIKHSNGCVLPLKTCAFLASLSDSKASNMAAPISR